MEDQSREYGQMNFTLPHDVVQLPSRGIFYKNKKKSLKVGYLTAADENILLGNADDLTYALLRSKIYEPDVKVDDLLEGDVEAVLIFLRNTSFGPEVEMTLTDPVTQKPFNTTVLIDTLPIINGKEPNEDGTFDVVLPKSNANAKLKPLTYGEINEISKMVERYPPNLTAPRVTWRLQKQIVEINGTQDKVEIAKFVDQMPIMDSKFIRTFMNQNAPRLDMTKEVIAPSGGKLQINVGFGVEFFRPFF